MRSVEKKLPVRARPDAWNARHSNCEKSPGIPQITWQQCHQIPCLRSRLSDERPCVLVLMGSLEDGTKKLIEVVAGKRESKLFWQALLADPKRRGLNFPA
ncbi:MAG TPA: hypothetical protein VFA74_16120 [Terriglobales bacterium]|nr:hypothetical protein [Terriglobales bacterium]